MKLFSGHRDVFLIKLFSFNSIGVLLRTILGLISQKLIAIYLGTEGVTLVGNLRNALAIFGLASTAGIDQGVLKYQAEFQDDKNKIKVLYGTSVAYSFIGSGFVFLLLFFGAKYWSLYLFKTEAYAYLFIILSFTVPFTALYNLCFAIINGKSNYKKATFISLGTYSIVTLLVICLVVLYQLPGVLLAVTLTPIAQLVVLILFAKSEMRLFSNLKIKFHKFFTSKIFIFIIMSVTAVVLHNVVDLQLRNYLISKLTIQDAGYWTSMSSLSNYYLSFMTGLYSLYVLPKYSKMNNFKLFKIELIRIYKIIIPVFLILFCGMYFFRELIIELLYTKEFLPMEQLFKWQLIGDLIKIIAVIMAYQLIAQKLWKIFIFTEVLSCALLYVFSLFFIKEMGVEGIVFSHFLRYVVYLILIFFLIRNIFKKTELDYES